MMTNFRTGALAFTVLALASLAPAGAADYRDVAETVTCVVDSLGATQTRYQNDCVGDIDAGAILFLVEDAGTPTCSGDPCSTAVCSPGTADAYAHGSEHAWADASVGANSASQDGVPTAAAHADGTGDSDASSKGKRDWSWKESNSDCHFESTTETLGMGGIGCTADETIAQVLSFTGQVYSGPAGDLVAYDPVLGLGLAVPAGGVTIDGLTPGALVPMDVAGLAPLSALLAFDLANGESGPSCSVSLA